MKQRYAMDLLIGEELTEWFLAKRAEVKTGSNGKQYFDILLGDKSGEIAGKKWDLEPSEADMVSRIRTGELVKIKGEVKEWAGSPQIRITRIRTFQDGDNVDIKDFIKAAPEPPEKMFAWLKKKAEEVVDEDFRKVALALLTENEKRLLYYPAAKTHHHAIFAGLLWHIKRMLMLAEHCCEVYTFLNKDLLMTGVLIHDMEKLNEMSADETGLVSEYTLEGQMLGHLVMGARKIEKLGEELKIPREKLVLLEHMMISHHYEPEFGSPKKPMFAEAEALHYMDMLDTKLYDFEDNLSNLAPGTWSDWIRSLNSKSGDSRRIYKPTL